MTKREQQQDEYAGLPPELAKPMRSLGAAIAAKTKREKADKPKQPAAVIQLPLWQENTKGTPNSFLRSALFAAIQGKERQAFKRELLASQKGITIRFTGWQLDQSDLDVWEQTAELAQSHLLGNECHFRINAFLRSIGRNTGKSDHEWLKGSFARFMSAGVEITQGKCTYGGSLLEFWRDEDTEAYRIRLNPEILKLYTAGWTAVDWNTRQKLRRKPLALWLHGYYSSHAKPLPVKVDTLRSLSGSKAKKLYHFRAALRQALDELKVTGAIVSWQINAADLVTVHRGDAITASQRRHLTRARLRRKRKD
jgi:hypothetical protein